MTELSTTEIEPRTYSAPSWELWARYFAAYACMLIAIGAAWPLIQAPFGPVLVLLTLAGLPLSLWLRLNGVRFNGRPVNRMMLSSIIVGLTMVLSTAFLAANTGGFSIFSGGLLNALTAFAADRTFGLAVSLVLIFGVCRCLFILTDKDALMCSVAAFIVLFVLIVVQREPGIVLDFIGWTVMTATLLALDHRHESRRGLSGFVKANVPGQDVKLSARSLATIMIVSLSCSVALSYTLAASDSNSRSAFESFLRLVVGGISNVSNDQSNANDPTTQTEPQSTIDYRSGPPLPTRTVLWKMGAEIVRNLGQKSGETQVVFPSYWRLSSLARYDGAAWTQGIGVSQTREVEPRIYRNPRGFRYDNGHYYDLRNAEKSTAPKPSAKKPSDNKPSREESLIARTPPSAGRVRIVQYVFPALASSGSVPIPFLPSVQIVVRGRSYDANVRTSEEGAVTFSATRAEKKISAISDVVPVPEYGATSPIAMSQLARANAGLKLSAREQKIYLQLPRMSNRVLDLARRLSRGEKDPFRRAQNMAASLQKMATYTLRPPNLPDETDATDFFLFESRRGYCTHFAGALTILCRIEKIPARVVTGFANVEREIADGQSTGLAVARSANAHAWTEIWLDGIGWVPLDATPADDRGDNSPTIWGDLSDRFGAGMAALWTSIQSRTGLWVAAIAALVVVSALGFLLNRRLRERKIAWSLARRVFGKRAGQKGALQASDVPDMQEDLAARATIFSAYNKASKTLAKRFRPRAAWQTPHDWLQEAESELCEVDLTPLHTLTDLHRRAMYNPQLFSEAERRMAREAQAKIARHKFAAAK